MDKYRVVALMGKSASGKDTILDKVCEEFPSLNKKISTTTRPPREGEEDGVNYYFIDGIEFAQKVLDYEMVEACEFRDWFYGTELRTLKKDKVNIGVFSPEGIIALEEDSRIEVLTLYVIASNKHRIIRSLNREIAPDIDEIFRRYRTDEEDFQNLDFNFVPIINEDKSSIRDIVMQVKEEILKKFGQVK